MVFDSNLCYENGLYRTPAMFNILSHKNLKMKEKRFLIIKKKDLLDKDPHSGGVRDPSRTLCSIIDVF